MPKRTIFAIILSFANAIFMLWLTFFLLSITQVLPDEYTLVQWSSIGKNLVLGLEKKPDSSRFLFVNVCFDKILIDKFDEVVADAPKNKNSFTDFWLKDHIEEVPKPKIDTTAKKQELALDSIAQTQEPALDTSTTVNPPEISEPLKLPTGSLAITDRAKLVAFMQLLHKKPNHKALLIDIELKDPTPQDSALTALINAVPRTVVSCHVQGATDALDLPDLKIKPLGISNLEKSYGMALKFKLHYNDTVKTTPIRLYEIIHNKKLKKERWFYTLNNQPILTSFILDYRVRKFDYDNSRYPKVILGEWMNETYGAMYIPCVPTDYNIDSVKQSYADDFFYKLTKDRIIVIGDFEDRDIHETIYGPIPGPIILLDAFLAVEAGDNIIRVGFLLLLFFAYFFISYVIFLYNQIYPKWVEKIIFRRTDYKESFLETFTIFLLYFATVSVFSFFYFNTHVGVLVLAFYMNLLENIKRFGITRRIVRFALREKAVVKNEII